MKTHVLIIDDDERHHEVLSEADHFSKVKLGRDHKIIPVFLPLCNT